MKFNRLQHLISALQTQIAVTLRTVKFVAPNPHIGKMVVSEVLVLVSPAPRTLIAEEKVNVVNLIDVPRPTAMDVIQILTVVPCIAVRICLAPMTMYVDITASERLVLVVQTVADQANTAPPVKNVGNLDLTVGKTLSAKEMESVVKVACVLLNAPGRVLLTASSGSVANMASVVQAVTETIVRLIAIVEGRRTNAVNVVT